MQPSTISIILLTALAGLGCVSSNPGYARSSRGEVDERPADRTLHLYRIDIDAAAVRTGAPLLFTEPPPREQFGLERRAQGYFNVSDRGFCDIKVRVAEPVVGIGGRRSEHRYTLVSFFGKISEDGERATTQAGESVSQSSVSRPDEVRFTARGDDKVTVQAFRAGKPFAYRYHFLRRGFSKPDVPFPWKVR